MTVMGNGNKPERLSLIGFGEAGQAFVEGWGPSIVKNCHVFDIKTAHAFPDIAAGKRADYSTFGVSGAETLEAALAGSTAVFSLVTADQAEKAAGDATAFLGDGAFFFDCNSCSPGTKRRSEAAINAAGGRYVDTAVMASVRPGLHKTPLLISGPYVEEAAVVLRALDMNVEIVEGPTGTASSIKMVRSIMMKGFEAVFMECVLAGRLAGVDERVLASLDATFPGFDFKETSHYMLERVMKHGIRRAAEMREVAVTVEELGLAGRIAGASAAWQDQIGSLAVPTDGADYQGRADAILAHLLPDSDKSGS